MSKPTPPSRGPGSSKASSSKTTASPQPRLSLSETIAAKRAAAAAAAHQQQELVLMPEDPFQGALDAQSVVRKSTGLVYDDRMALHRNPWDSRHIESPERLLRTFERISTEFGLASRCEIIQPRPASDDEILSVHSYSLLNAIESSKEILSVDEIRQICLSNFPTVYMNRNSFDSAKLAAGCAVDLTAAVVEGRVQNGLALIRPPGHHADKSEASGFCLFNNVAIAARQALKSVSKILIVDFDVHHGQGTQREFYADPRVLYFSIHRYEYGKFHPRLEESNFDHIGEKDGLGFNANLPLNEINMGDSEYLAIFHQILLPMAYEFQPDLVLVSAGFDAAFGCPQGQMKVSPIAYGHLVSSLMALANGKVVLFLEGGYFVESLADGVAMSLRALLGDACVPLAKLSPPVDSLVDSVLSLVSVLRPYWKYLAIQEQYDDQNLEEDESNFVPNFTFINSTDESPDDEDYFVYSEEKVKELMETITEMRKVYLRQMEVEKRQKKVALVYNELMTRHTNLDELGHPEKPNRIRQIYSTHREYGLLKRIHAVNADRRATEEEICLVHDQPHFESMANVPNFTSQSEREEFGDSFDSIYFHPDSFDCSLLAAGNLLNVVDSVCSGESQRGVAIIRPPGHHAEPDEPMGFCIMNNVAVAAAYARKMHELKRVLIFDWDIHHGNGTQKIFYDDPNVLYISIHRYDGGCFFPAQPDANYDYVGSGKGEGFNVNIPWDGSGMGDPEYLVAFFNVVLPIAYEFNPELVFISAGFDAAIGDPLGHCKVSPQTYGHMTHHLANLAGGKVILALEGGYNLNSISLSMTMCTKALLGDPLPKPKNSPPPKARAIEAIRKTIKAHRNYWSCLKFNDKKLPVNVNFFRDVKNKEEEEEEEALVSRLTGLSLVKSEDTEYIPCEYGRPPEDTSVINTISSQDSSMNFSTKPSSSQPCKD